MSLILDSNTELAVVLAAAKATNDCTIMASYVDVTTTSTTGAPQTSTTNGTTAVDVVTEPAANTQRVIKSIMMENADTAAITATFRTDNAGTLTTVITLTLQAGDNCFYEDAAGWFVLDTNGQLRTAGPQAGRQIRAPQYLTSGTSYTIPTGCNAIEIEMVGSGGGGGGASQTAANAAVGGGGAAGGYLRAYIANPQATAITYAINTGGNGGANTGGTGGTAGNTTITVNSVLYTANSGAGAPGMTAGVTALTALGGAGATPTNGDVNARGMPGEPAIRMSGTVAVSGNGANSPFGGGGIGLTAEGAGTAATGYGAGGGGACCLGTTAQTGGAGTQGLIKITEYY